MKRISTGLFGILASVVLLAQTPMPAITRVGIAELQSLAAKYLKADELVNATKAFPTAMVHGKCMVGFLGKVSDEFMIPESSRGHVMVGARIGDIVSFRVDAYHLDALAGLSGLQYVELAAKATRTLDKVVVSTRADSVQQGINLPQSYTGRDVLIGVTDWGFDYTHPMFYDTAITTSRVRAAWDQYRQVGPSPADFPYGTELNTPEALMTAGSDTINIYGNATHGSHVAGIAGGGGAGTEFRGIAFDAQFLFCTWLVDAAAVIDAFTWMKAIAEQDEKRLVINMSWGLNWIGTLDGNSLISQAIEQYAAEGVVFVASGGNNGNVNFHIKKAFSGDTLRSRIQFYPYDANPNMWGQSLTMWGEVGNAFSAGIFVNNSNGVTVMQTPIYSTATQPAYLDSFLLAGTDTVYFNLTSEAAHPLNDRPHFRLRVKNENTQLRVILKATAVTGTVHIWNMTELTNDVGNWGQEFQAYGAGSISGDDHYAISEPACTENLITVGAYSSETQTQSGQFFGGALAGFSSEGPTMDDRMKPDITAPGVSVASSISSFTDEVVTAVATVDHNGRSYPFARFSGTSMSGPAVAGIVAMILEAHPGITPAEVRELLKQTARLDNNTGVIPAGGSTIWGFGKANAYHAVRQALGLVSIEEQASGTAQVWPNPVSNELLIQVPGNIASTHVSIQDLTGRQVFIGNFTAADRIAINTEAWSSGLYLVRVQQGDGSFISKVVKD
ncbi:MAG: S8 family peptidase [Flavobacteriales bacterium]|nr:S8 family peptidase [Flavobacteriales bacterium]